MLLVYTVALLCCLDQRFFLALLVAGPCNTFDQTRTRAHIQTATYYTVGGPSLAQTCNK